MKTRNSNHKEAGTNFKEIYSLLIKSYPLLYVLSILLSVSILINMFLATSQKNYFIVFSIPEILTTYQGYFILALLSVFILIGSIGSYLRWKYAIGLLTGAWGLQAFGIKMWDFMWLPTINFGLPISFGFLGSLVYIKINLVPLFFFIWSLSLLLKTNHN
jgi:hypothetical protein